MKKISFVSLVLIIGLILLPVISCDNQSPIITDDDRFVDVRGDNQHEMVLYDTLELGLNEYVYNTANELMLEFDSMVQDCRCPEDVVCCWAGYATAQFKLTINNRTPITFILETSSGRTGEINQYAIFDKFVIKLINCLPYPNTKHIPDKSEYKVLIKVSPVDKH